MKEFEPIKKLDVYRRLSAGKEILLGQLVQNKTAVYFQYDADYLAHQHSVSPFSLPFTNELTEAPPRPHQGLHGVFADSLPDGWGLLLMDRVFRQKNIQPQQLTAMDRLAYIGDSGIGAFSYRPVLDWKERSEEWVDLGTLGKQATQLFDGGAEAVLAALANTGGSGGARPKSLIYINPQQANQVSTFPQDNLEPWLIKFTSENLLLGHEEGLCEAAYLTMAKQAGINVPNWQLFETPNSSKAKAWLATKRFDCSTDVASGRYHTHTLCGLLDADFRQPSMDYEDMIKASQALCRSPAVGKLQFTRAMFNLFADNQDDHTKNWSFLMDDNGQWKPAPFYDVTFSPSPHNQHMMAYAGHAQQPSIEAIQKIAVQANFANWKEAQNEIKKIIDALSQWTNIASDLDVAPSTIKMISAQLNRVYQLNKGLLD
ncbi:MAG: type II toxin-antitoxin system HipA family toxin [Thiotrichaceae bacterium]